MLPLYRWAGPDEDERQAAVRYWKRAIQITVDLGCDVMNSEFNGRPSRRLRLAGVTGTDGKTTTTHMAEHVLQASGLVAGAMSSVAYRVSGSETDNVSGQTTTESPQVQAWLRRMVDAGVECAVIETTSHALVQERVAACDFDVAAFTNVGHDHLDYHPTCEEYLEAKAKLIDITARAVDKGVEKTAVLNRDDPSYERLSRRPISRRWSYAARRDVCVTARARAIQRLQRAVRSGRLPRPWCSARGDRSGTGKL